VKRARTSAAVASLAAVALLAGACGGGGTDSSTSSKAAPSATKNDINPTPREQVQDGGTLHWPLNQIPTNFNINELDGSLADNDRVISSMMPSAFLFDAGGKGRVNTDFVTDAKLTSTDPQVVTYEINPKAAWYDGTPITEADFEAQWKALNGTDKAFNVASTQGYDKIKSVTKGKDEREVVVTFAQKYADWQALFGPLYPASTNSDPKVFNEGWIAKPLTSAGPFRLDSIDQTAKTITVVRNEKWWGEPAKLDKIIYRVVPSDSQIDALANGEIDFMDIGPDVNALQRAQSTPGITIHKAGGPNFRHITINGAGPILSDLNVRQAIAMGIDRAKIAQALLGPLGVPTTPLNNHIFMANQNGYKDNSGDVGTFNPERARQLLDQAGWTQSGTFRRKGGKELDLRFVIPANVAASKQESELVQGMLEDIGVNVKIDTVPLDDFFDKYITPGNFDLTVFAWLGTPFPISSSKSIYAKPTKDSKGQLVIQQNYARVGSDQIDALFDQATAELEPASAIDIANQIDGMLWNEVHSLTTYQRPDIVATKSNLANYGAFGFASRIYQDIGFTK
jgi:peptide/nickel transport system substrate-binding protein